MSYLHSFSVGTSASRHQTPLTIEQIAQYAPSALATRPHESRSERYTYIPTVAVSAISSSVAAQKNREGTMYQGTVIPELSKLVDAILERHSTVVDETLNRQIKEWFQELDQFYYARPCWDNKRLNWAENAGRYRAEEQEYLRRTEGCLILDKPE